MTEKIKPHGDYVVVEILDQKKTKGGLIIPEKARGSQRDAIVGKVVAVGKGRLTELELDVSGRGSDAKKVRIIRDQELLGTVEESRIISLGLVT